MTIPRSDATWPTSSLSPSNPLWLRSRQALGPIAWHLVMLLLYQFGLTASEFTPADVRSWSCWGKQPTERAIRALAQRGIVMTTGRGTYRLQPRNVLEEDRYVEAREASERDRNKAARLKQLNPFDEDVLAFGPAEFREHRGARPGRPR